MPRTTGQKWGLVRRFINGKLQTISHPALTHRQKPIRVKTLLYEDNVTNLSGPIVGGAAMPRSARKLEQPTESEIKTRLGRALQGFGSGSFPAPKQGGRMCGGSVAII
jgi:hypothetical protein